MEKLPNFLQLSLIITLIVCLIFLYLWQSWRVIYLQRRINKLKDRLTPVRARYHELKVEAARYFSYQRIERIAKEKLGMVEPRIKEPSEPNNG